MAFYFTQLYGLYRQTDKLKDSVNNSIEDIINEKSLTLSNQVKELEKNMKAKYKKQKQ